MLPFHQIVNDQGFLSPNLPSPFAHRSSFGFSTPRIRFSGGTGIWLSLVTSVPVLVHAVPSALAQEGGRSQRSTMKPNILVIRGDDVGWENISAYGLGVMGYTKPNLDSIGMQGIRFTDHYAQPSCTAGRAAFITGQYPIRSGTTTVGQPGDALGLQAASPCLAEVLKQPVTIHRFTVVPSS